MQWMTWKFLEPLRLGCRTYPKTVLNVEKCEIFIIQIKSVKIQMLLG